MFAAGGVQFTYHTSMSTPACLILFHSTTEQQQDFCRPYVSGSSRLLNLTTMGVKKQAAVTVAVSAAPPEDSKASLLPGAAASAASTQDTQASGSVAAAPPQAPTTDASKPAVQIVLPAAAPVASVGCAPAPVSDAAAQPNAPATAPATVASKPSDSDSSNSSSDSDSRDVWTENEGESSDNDEEAPAHQSLRGWAGLLTAPCPRNYLRDPAVRKARNKNIPEDFTTEQFLATFRRVFNSTCNESVEKATCHNEPHKRYKPTGNKRERHFHIAFKVKCSSCAQVCPSLGVASVTQTPHSQLAFGLHFRVGGSAPPPPPCNSQSAFGLLFCAGGSPPTPQFPAGFRFLLS